LLFDRNKNSASTSQTADAEFITDAIPAGFDASAFIDGAKIAYKTLQQAWDERDLAEIRSLTTDKVFVEIQEQLHASAEDNKTDILKLDAELLEVREIGSDIEAVVLFDAILREAQDTQAGQVREVWHFTKPNHNRQTKWLLDGIQQLED
jgi:predicted lipid-binding transport protein (Tim44 family)